MAAGGAHDAAIAEPPASAVAALRAHEPLWPSHPLEVVETVGIGTEPSLELAHGPRVVHAATGPGHPANLLRLNGDPQGGYCTRRMGLPAVPQTEQAAGHPYRLRCAGRHTLCRTTNGSVGGQSRERRRGTEFPKLGIWHD